MLESTVSTSQRSPLWRPCRRSADMSGEADPWSLPLGRGPHFFLLRTSGVAIGQAAWQRASSSLRRPLAASSSWTSTPRWREWSLKLTRDGIGVNISVFDGTDVAYQRDYPVDEFLRSEATHILLVDFDMMFGDDLCSKLLAFEKDMIGAAYTACIVNLDEFRSEVRSGKDFDQSWRRAHKFVFGKLLRHDGNLFEVDVMGLGFALISRSVFDRLAREGDLGRYPAAANFSVQRTGTLLGFFDRMQGSDGRISEDFSFCHRWRKIGGQVWLDPTANIRRVGTMRFGFPLAAALTRRES